jgi:TolB-like protein/tRNA A-37 threonylcarbamoyl transferase component Bud32
MKVGSYARECPACKTPLPEDAQFCLRCGAATPTEPGVPPRTGATEVAEVSRVRKALAAQYRIDRVIGEGGMATVYLAQDLKHRRQVAVKVMRPELASTLGAERFLREVEIAAQLSHPHILPVYDSGEADGILYYVMPYIEGETLWDRIRRESQLPVEDAVRIAREVSEALAYAHDRKIIHRDIKPANILMSGGHALVADFGIARAVGAVTGGITKTGLSVGTPHYMSPEQASGMANLDARSDIYAIGCVLYEMIAGEPPFTGPTPQAIIARSLTETPRPLTATRQGLSPALDAVVARALARNAADRWQTAADLSTALGKALDSPQTSPTGTAARSTPGDEPSLITIWGLFLGISAAALLMVYGLVQRFGLPSKVLVLAVALVAIGALVFIATGNVEARRRAGRAPTGLLSLLSWKNAAIGGLAALGLWIAVASVLVLRGTATGSTTTGTRLAVLPFENRGAPDDAYIVDGIADQVRGKLAGIGGFLVTARTSSDLYRDSKKQPGEIGRELGVDYLLAATVRWSKDASGNARIQVSPELIDVRSGASKWAGSYDAAMADLFQVQGTIASQVVQVLGVSIDAAQQQDLAERPTSNLAAWDAFLRGERARSSGRNADGLREYSQAVALDSTFALGWARLSFAASAIYFPSPSAEMAVRARQAAARAMALDSTLPLARNAMGSVLQLIDGDQAGALREFEAGLLLAPNDPQLLRSAAGVKRSLGQIDEAIALTRRGVALDPRSANPYQSLGAHLIAKRATAAADSVYESGTVIAPTSLALLIGRVMTRLQRGDLAGARTVIAAMPSSVPPTRVASWLAVTWDLYWALSDEHQRLLFRLQAGDFDDDRVSWALALAGTSRIRGDAALAKAYGDSARIELDARLKEIPDDNYLLALRGLAHAHAGNKAEAIRDGERSLQLLPLSKDAVSAAYNLELLAKTYTIVGEPDKAVDALRQLLDHPYHLTRAWIRIDPDYAPLKNHPGFQRLIAGP